MKKICIPLILILLLSGCGNNNSSSGTESNATTEVTTIEASTTEGFTEEFTEESTTISTVNDVAEALIEKNIISGEPIKVSAEMIGAIDGIKYSDYGVEIYEYDTSSDTYKTLKSGGEVPISGMDGYTISADAINGKFVLFLSNDKNQTIIDEFNKLDVGK